MKVYTLQVILILNSSDTEREQVQSMAKQTLVLS